MFKHILLPTDGSVLSVAATERAAELAKTLGACITVLYCKPEFPAVYYGEGIAVESVQADQFAELTQSQADTILAEAMAACNRYGVACETLAVDSDAPFEAIIENAESKGADLIFMASHGRRGLSALLLGSETHKVLTHSRIPVLVYRQS